MLGEALRTSPPAWGTAVVAFALVAADLAQVALQRAYATTAIRN